MTPVAELVARDGAAADLSGPLPAATDTDTDAADAASRLRAVSSSEPTDDAALFAAWDAVAATTGGPDDLERLDQVLADGVPGGLFGGFSPRRRRLREQARRVLTESPVPSTVRLAAAVLGATGERRDAEALERLARHPALTLHAATALANLGLVASDARLALLRLMNVTHGTERVIVIDRLLAFVRDPAVRLGLVRDALVGLDAEHAREVAGAIAEVCDVERAADDPASTPEMRAGARLVLRHRGDASH